MPSKASKLRAKILDAKDIRSEAVTISEWDVTVDVRGLTGAQLVDITTAAVVTDDDGTKRTDNNLLARGLILASVYDPETNELVFEPSDADALYAKCGLALNKLAAVSMRLNGLAGEDVEKNSEATATAAGASA